MTDHERYMHRCLELARLGQGMVAPNPMVGAVLVHDGRIIGEGWHRCIGNAHAEVECLSSVRETDRQLIPSSILYVSLEPCAHQGRTPPCADRIIRERIPEVVVACRDPFPLVDGKGIERLRDAGLRVTCGVLETEALELNRRFITFHVSKRPYVVLKWAQTADGMVAGPGKNPSPISGAISRQLLHLWRAREQAIMVGPVTVRNDDPLLTCRNGAGRNPVRITIDRDLSLPPASRIFQPEAETVLFNLREEGRSGHLQRCRVDDAPDLLPQILSRCHALQIQSILVEGGTRLLGSFLRNGLWDEAIRITAMDKRLPGGYPGPPHVPGVLTKTDIAGDDRIEYFRHA
jgi:diaminohydroxyphosphoribosylaminopyrimidine deaminase/5-amino-6-(5-phosphoribosylamino)uracil reductase